MRTMKNLRVALAAAVLLTVMPSVASALPFTVEFVVTWDSVNPSPAVMGSGSIIGFVVDNGAPSPLGQTYLVTDVKAISVDATPFGGTYIDTFPIIDIGSNPPHVLFDVAGSGQAVMDFNKTGGTPFYSPSLYPDLSWFAFEHTVHLWWEMDRISFFTATCFCSSDPSAFTFVSNNQLVGAVAVPDSPDPWTMLSVALGCVIAVRRWL